MRFRISLQTSLFLLAAVLVVLLCLTAGPRVSRAAGTVSFSDGRLSIRADNEPLLSILEKIAHQAGIVIFIVKDFEPGTLTLHLEDQPLEKAMDRILKGFNVARIYRDHPSGDPELTAVEIYPGDRYGGALDVIVRADIPRPDISPADNSARYSSMRDDTLHPQGYVHAVEYDALVPAALAFEKKENDAWQDIQALKTQANNEIDETRNQVLTLALLDRYDEFEQMQRHHIDLLEKMHRVEHFMETRAGRSHQLPIKE
jgi:hypothetical protein